MRRPKYFNGWVGDYLTVAYDRLMPKLMYVYFRLLKIQGYEHIPLPKFLWDLKKNPEQFKQLLPPKAQYKLEVNSYGEKFYIQPENYPTFQWGDSKGEVLPNRGKELVINLSKLSVPVIESQEARYGNNYKFTGDEFAFCFKHSVSGKDSSDRLYQMTKDSYCTFNGGSGYKYKKEFNGKFCSRPFTYSELVPTLLQSMDRQFDFRDSKGQRLEWYEELRSEIKQPTILPKNGSEPDVHTFWMGEYYNDVNYPAAIALWESRKMDYLLGEEEEVSKVD